VHYIVWLICSSGLGSLSQFFLVWWTIEIIIKFHGNLAWRLL
jgi:hypothetical protein